MKTIENIIDGAFKGHNSWNEQRLWLYAQIQQALEAQHRETWAMAIKAVYKASIPRNYGRDASIQDLRHTIRSLPCPPLTPNESE